MDVHPSFAERRAWFERYRRRTLEAQEPITAENVAVVEHVLMEAEVDAAREALADAGPPRFDPGAPSFAQQTGTTCMSTSLANGLISLGEPGLAVPDDEERERRVHRLTADIVERTSSFGKPGEYRSVDDLFKYCESGRLREVDLGGGKLEGDYRVRLTCSLLDVVEALWTGRARLVIQRRAHAHLAFGLALADPDGDAAVLMRDPMHGTGPGSSVVPLEVLRQDFLWSPLKKIPRLMGPHAFPSLTAEALLGHLARYDGMENLGVECPSALVYRAADAPALLAPPPEDGAS